MNSPAKDMRAIGRIAKAAILHDLCPKGMGVSMKDKSFTRKFVPAAQSLQATKKGMVIIMKKKIGVLAVQGAFAEHISMLNKLDAVGFEIRQKSDLTEQAMDGIILPGGESTVIGKLLKELDMFDYLKEAIKDGLPVFGTCAGLILLAKDISNDNHKYFETMDITVRRNAYGRQLGSFHTLGQFKGIGEIPMTFIRAPVIEKVSFSEGVEVLATVNDHIVAARQRNMLVTSFHPEVTQDLRVHQFFLAQKS